MSEIPYLSTLKFGGKIFSIDIKHPYIFAFTRKYSNKMQEKKSEKEPIQNIENKTGMPDNLKSGVESLSGIDMSDVKVHFNSSQPAQLNALAYAQGTDIHVGPGQEQHLPHEAWHIVQQKQGRVQATHQTKTGVAVNDDKALENEADVMGRNAKNERTI